jgi:valyl-tRNA synthetase
MGDVDIYLHFSGLLDVGRERHEIQEKIAELTQIKSTKEAGLKNPEFLKKAPPEVVEKEKQGIEELKNSLKRLERMRDDLH